MSNDKDLEIECLRDALDHIQRTALASRSETRRLKWIAARAVSALNNDTNWKNLDIPADRENAVSKLLRKNRDLDEENAKLQKQVESLAAWLSGIHMAIYPQLTQAPDGKTYRFVAPDPHEYLQALADRIRSIPEELAAIASQPQGGEGQPVDALLNGTAVESEGGHCD